MQLKKITDQDLTGKGVVGQSDTPGLSALEMQKKVEEIAREVIIPIFNENVQTLEENAGTTDGTLAQKADKTYVDAQDTAINEAIAAQKQDLEEQITQGDSQTLQSANAYTDEQLKTKADASNTYTKAQNDALLQQKANLTDVLTKENTTPFTPVSDYQPVTKKYADDLALKAGTVTSVFGRAGEIVAQEGDYTAEQITQTSARQFVSQQEKETWNASGGVVYTITLTASGWVQAGDIFTQAIVISNSTANTKVDLYTDVATEAKIASPIRAVNDNGTITAQTLVAPSEDLTVQAIACEVKEGA